MVEVEEALGGHVVVVDVREDLRHVQVHVEEEKAFDEEGVEAAEESLVRVALVVEVQGD